jgi:hypothetical protein
MSVVGVAGGRASTDVLVAAGEAWDLPAPRWPARSPRWHPVSASPEWGARMAAPASGSSSAPSAYRRDRGLGRLPALCRRSARSVTSCATGACACSC